MFFIQNISRAGPFAPLIQGALFVVDSGSRGVLRLWVATDAVSSVGARGT